MNRIIKKTNIGKAIIHFKDMLCVYFACVCVCTRVERAHVPAPVCKYLIAAMNSYKGLQLSVHGSWCRNV